MAKVYIVSSGEYSDWYIRKIFLDKSKADTYHDLCGNNVNDVEEYDTSDDEIIIPIHYCYIEYCVLDQNYCSSIHKLSGNYEFEIRHANTQDSDEGLCTYTHYNHGKLILSRVIHGNINENELSEKYLKVCQDYSALIRDQIVNGANDYDIGQMINNK